MNWLKKHSDAVSVIAALAIAVWVMLGTTHAVEMRLSKDINKVRHELSHEISLVNNEIVKIQTVMIVKGIAPKELFTTNEEKK